MANPNRAYADNVSGNFFVDDTCIDCDLCRQIAPSVFKEESDHSAVYHQPDSVTENHRAAMALVACPTGSIGTRRKVDSRTAAASYPELIDENVYFCGYASPNSYGASSYLITRPEGNALIDSPRFARTLVRRIEEMGGISLMLFSHRDDVADHEKIHEHFGCPRVIHQTDARGINDAGEITGIYGDLYRNKFLFTGDHLAWSDNRRGLIAFRDVAWYSWREQTRSMKRLLDFPFEWVLPGHGRRAHQSQDAMHQSLINCIEWMERTK